MLSLRSGNRSNRFATAITDQRSLAGAADQHSNHKDRSARPVRCSAGLCLTFLRPGPGKAAILYLFQSPPRLAVVLPNPEHGRIDGAGSEKKPPKRFRVVGAVEAMRALTGAVDMDAAGAKTPEQIESKNDRNGQIHAGKPPSRLATWRYFFFLGYPGRIPCGIVSEA